MEITYKSFAFSSMRKRKRLKKIMILTEINHLDENFTNNGQVINTKKEFEIIRNHRLIVGSIIRSKARWINESSGKPTIYILN